ncbi:MAG: suppressor of fused domain protein [Myxococcaceae bacterium]|nr:suppressor of fused domain protein [Myxococcaceae bacterium]
MNTYKGKLLAHYERFWSRPVWLGRWKEPPHSSLAAMPVEFEVARFRRSPDTDVYATVAMSEPGMDSVLELHVIAGTSSDEVADRIVELLTVTAHYHRTGAALRIGHSVNFGEPWVAGSACTHGLISLPYLDGPSLERVAESDATCAWLLPITPSEVALKKSAGLDALEERFERAELNYLDWMRRPVV